MALLTCEDCGHKVSDVAAACPSCGRPSSATLAQAVCDRCGRPGLVTGTGLHGLLEAATTVVWSVGGCLLLGVGFYFYGNSRPWCPQGRHRPKSAGLQPGFLVFLILVGLLAAWWAIALATGTAQ